MQAEFLRYTAIAANGPNPGLADIEFTTVPEPEILAALCIGISFLPRLDAALDLLLISACRCRYKVSKKRKRMVQYMANFISIL